jgi:hypothetical protein
MDFEENNLLNYWKEETSNPSVGWNDFSPTSAFFVAFFITT